MARFRVTEDAIQCFRSAPSATTKTARLRSRRTSRPTNPSGRGGQSLLEAQLVWVSRSVERGVSLGLLRPYLGRSRSELDLRVSQLAAHVARPRVSWAPPRVDAGARAGNGRKARVSTRPTEGPWIWTCPGKHLRPERCKAPRGIEVVRRSRTATVISSRGRSVSFDQPVRPAPRSAPSGVDVVETKAEANWCCGTR
jgi:hypothetical protein